MLIFVDFYTYQFYRSTPANSMSAQELASSRGHPWAVEERRRQQDSLAADVSRSWLQQGPWWVCWKLSISDDHTSFLCWCVKFYFTIFQSLKIHILSIETTINIKNNVVVHLFPVHISPKLSFAGWLYQAGHPTGGEEGGGQNEVLGRVGQWG